MTTITPTQVLDLIPVEGDEDVEARFVETFAETEFEPHAGPAGELTINLGPVVSAPMTVAAAAVQYCADVTGRSRAEVVYELRLLLESASNRH